MNDQKISALRLMLVLALGILLSSSALWVSAGFVESSERSEPTFVELERVQDRAGALDLDTQIFLHRNGRGGLDISSQNSR